MVFFVWRPFNSLNWWNNSELRNVIGCADCQPTCFHSFFFSLLILSCVGVLVPCIPGVPASSRTCWTFFFTRMYSYVTRMLLVCTRHGYPYVLVFIRRSSVCTRMYSYVLVWCFSHDLPLLLKTKLTSILPPFMLRVWGSSLKFAFPLLMCSKNALPHPTIACNVSYFQ